MPEKLHNISKGASELAVESRQLPRYLADGWGIIPEKNAKATVYAQDANPGDLIEVWRGEELRICTVDQLGQMAVLGFEARKKETADAGQSGNHDAGRPVDEPVGDPEPGNERAGSGSEVGMAGDTQPEPGAEAGLDDEQASGSLATGHFTLDRPNTDAEILEAYAKLDAENDDHWTKYGLPRIEVLNTFLEHGPVTRTQLNKVAGNPVRPAKS